MKITRFVTAPIPEADARQRIILYLAQAGYEQLPAAGGLLAFRRGSMIGSYALFNPLKWACTFKISLNSEQEMTKIYLTADITTDPTEKLFGAELLKAELDLLESAVVRNEFKIFDATNLKKRVSSQVKRVVGIFGSALLSVIFGIIFGKAISTTTSIGTAASVGIGAAITLISAALFMVLLRRRQEPGK
jgi:hypothetical protein